MTAKEFLDIEAKLTVKQKLFAQHYVKYGNLKNAILAAGFKPQLKNASSLGYKLICEPKIKAYIDALREYARQENMVSIQMVIDLQKDILTFNPFDTLKYEGGKFITKDLETLKPFGHLIKKYKIHRKSGEIEVEFYGKDHATEVLMKHLGGYKLDNEQKKPDNPVQIYLPDNGRDTKPATAESEK